MGERKTAETLRREARVLTAWIRDVTAPKQARLRQIRAELEAMRAESGGRRRSAR